MPDEGIKAKHNIIIPATHKYKHVATIGVIMAIGSPEQFKFKVGDKVVYSRYSGVQVNLKSKNDTDLIYLILSESDVLMCFKEIKSNGKAK